MGLFSKKQKIYPWSINQQSKDQAISETFQFIYQFDITYKSERLFCMKQTKSIIKSKIRNYPSRSIDVQNNLLEESLTKSYIYHAVSKIKNSTEKERNFLQATTDLVQKYEKQSEVFDINEVEQDLELDQIIEECQYRVAFKEDIIKHENFSCCSAHDLFHPGIVKFIQKSEMVIMNQKSGQTLYTINFNTISSRIQSSPLQNISFLLIIGNKLTIQFQEILNEQQQFKKFQIKLEQIIKQSRGLKFNMLGIVQYDDFAKKKYISSLDFMQKCQTGDIMLFKGRLFWSKVQRFVLGSDYDHVAMIYRDSVHGILLFQSTSFHGISLSPWEYVLKHKWYEYVDQISWRKLKDIDRDSSFIQKIQNFIIDKLGISYHISLSKLMSAKSYIYTKPIQNEEKQGSKKEKKKDDQIGYFCSQLIAKLYKQAGLLTSDENSPTFKPSCNYYPYHFTSKFALPFLKGSLQQENIINFHVEQIEDFYNS